MYINQGLHCSSQKDTIQVIVQLASLGISRELCLPDQFVTALAGCQHRERASLTHASNDDLLKPMLSFRQSQSHKNTMKLKILAHSDLLWYMARVYNHNYRNKLKLCLCSTQLFVGALRIFFFFLGGGGSGESLVEKNQLIKFS